jgi:hypothetical protein
MREPTEAEAVRVLRMKAKYSPEAGSIMKRMAAPALL